MLGIYFIAAIDQVTELVVPVHIGISISNCITRIGKQVYLHTGNGIAHTAGYIAGAALWLASDAVTGVALPVEAGHLLMPGVYTGA